MMTLLREGQSSRHGKQTPTPAESREAGEMAVQLASTLVLADTLRKALSASPIPDNT